VNDTDERDKLITQLICGEFDEVEFKRWCKHTYNVEFADSRVGTMHSYYKAVERSKKGTEPLNIEYLLKQRGF
jgi:hypothetical protein